jgi:hypothetical protein
LPQTTPRDLLWTAPQRRGLIALLAIFTVFLAVQMFRNSVQISDPQPVVGTRAGELASQIDPNVGTWEELAAIPTLGEKRAKAIVAMREQLLARRPNETPFKSIDDLTRVKGIGSATAGNLKPYLVFPSTAATTHP